MNIYLLTNSYILFVVRCFEIEESNYLIEFIVGRVYVHIADASEIDDDVVRTIISAHIIVIMRITSIVIITIIIIISSSSMIVIIITINFVSRSIVILDMFTIVTQSPPDA